jgi:hypothetical protein
MKDQTSESLLVGTRVRVNYRYLPNQGGGEFHNRIHTLGIVQRGPRKPRRPDFFDREGPLATRLDSNAAMEDEYLVSIVDPVSCQSVNVFVVRSDLEPV